MKSAIKRDLRILKSMSIRQFFNFAALKTSFFFSKYFNTSFNAKPYALSIELSAICNLNCYECKISCGDINRKNKFLSYSNFLHLLDNIPSSIFYVNLYFQGESFLNPDIIKIIKKLKQKGIYVCVSTNGNYKAVNAQEIASSGIDEIIFSIDGIQQEEYQKYRRGGDLELVLQNIKDLLAVRKLERPLLVMQTLAFKNTLEQKDDYISFFKNIGMDILEYKSVQIYHKEELKNLPKQSKYLRYNKLGECINTQAKRRFCWRMWSSCVISADLDVVICCFDKELDHKMGNISDMSLLEIWRSKKYKELRKSQQSFIANTSICQNCDQGLKTNHLVESRK